MPAKHRRHRVETEDTGTTDHERRKRNSEMREMGRGIVQVVSDSYDSLLRSRRVSGLVESRETSNSDPVRGLFKQLQSLARVVWYRPRSGWKERKKLARRDALANVAISPKEGVTSCRWTLSEFQIGRIDGRSERVRPCL